MKQLIFFLCLCVALITVAESWNNDASERVASKFVSSKEDVKNCILETNITLADLEVMAQIFQGEDTADKKDSALRIGCLFACMFKKKEWLDGTRIRNIQQLKRELSPENLDPGKHSEILDTCNNRIQNLTNECEVMLNFIKCITSEQIAATKLRLNDASERIGRKFVSSKEDVKNCIFETNITLADLEVMAQIFQGEDTADKKDSALRIGCLFACMFKKKEWLDGTRIRNVQQLKRELSPENLDPGKHFEILDTCNNRIQHLTNECEVMLNFVKCISSEQIAAMKPWLNDASERVASKFSISKPNAKNCFIKTEITAGDLALIRLLLNGETADIEESAFKIGCLYACVFKEKKWLTGTDLNVQELKRELSPKRSNPKRHDEILDICTNNVKNLPNECKVMTNFIICMSLQQKRSPS